jgi:hypothetical protein
MARKIRFRADRLVGSIKILIANAKKEGEADVTIDVAPLEALVELAEKADASGA